MRRNSLKFLELFLIGVLLVFTGTVAHAQQVRIKDLVNVRGNRTNQLIGFGLVAGLPGTGDSSASVAKSHAMANLMNRLGMNIKSEEATAASLAAVLVTADLPAFARNGDKLDVRIASMGDAKSLVGGTLISTPLKAGDGNVYAVAMGSLIVGQMNGASAPVLSTANLPAGAVVEREFSPEIAADGKIILSLRQPDFTTSARIADAINSAFKGFYAAALDPVSTEVIVPPLYKDRITEFMADLESIRVEVDQKAVVVLNQKSGTVVMGAEVQIGTLSIAHGDLSIQIGSADPKKAKSELPKRLVNVGGSTVGELVNSLNALGVKPQDLVSIIQSIHASGALRAELKLL